MVENFANKNKSQLQKIPFLYFGAFPQILIRKRYQDTPESSPIHQDTLGSSPIHVLWDKSFTPIEL